MRKAIQGLLLVACGGCGMFEMPGTVEDIKKTSDELKGKTTDTVDNVKETNKTASEIRDLSERLRILNQNGVPLKIRTEEYLRLIRDDQGLTAKEDAAGTIMKWYEFQLLPLREYQDEEFVNALLAEAVEEFFHNFKDFCKKVDYNTRPDSQSNAYLILKAVALSLEEHSRNQELLKTSGADIEILTMKSVIADGLERGKKSHANADPTWVTKVNAFEREATFFMELHERLTGKRGR